VREGCNLSTFKKALKDIDKAVQRGASRALNKAIKQTKTQVVRTLRSETSLKTEDINIRVRTVKSKPTILGVVLGIATKFGIPLRKFNPKEKKIKTSAGIRQGVTAKIGNAGRALVPGAFIMNVRGHELVAGRKQAYTKGSYINPTAPRLPTVQLKTDIFIDTAKANQSNWSKYLRDTFNRIVNHEIDFSLQQTLNKK
jgi:hypothetical protein